MSAQTVAIVRHKAGGDAVRRAVEISQAFRGISPGDRVFVKPNVVFWTRPSTFPKWGVITTSAVVQAVVALLHDAGVRKMTIGEGIVTLRAADRATPSHAFESLGYNTLGRRYGVDVVNVMHRPFRKVAVGEGVELGFSADALESDFIVSLPVLKTHAQTKVSLSIKNLKGLLDRPSRKKCHSADPAHDLNYMVSLVPEKLPPAAAVIDGIYTLERGPSVFGSPRRSDLVIASSDILSADLAGAAVLGHDPPGVPHLAHCAARRGRPADLSDVEIAGEPIDSVRAYHEYAFPYDEKKSLPLPMALMGIEGLIYPSFDTSLCTYCSHINGAMLLAIAYAWKGRRWDDVEVLTGKMMQPTPGMQKTILLGQCMCDLHRDNPAIREKIFIPGCPAEPDDALAALQRAGIDPSPGFFQNITGFPGLFMGRYRRRAEFDEAFYTVS